MRSGVATSRSTNGTRRGLNRYRTDGSSVPWWVCRSTEEITSGWCIVLAVPWQGGRPNAAFQRPRSSSSTGTAASSRHGVGLSVPPADDEWVQSEHNIFVDHQDNVSLGNYSGSHILKMSRDGRLLLQIGRAHAQGQDS